MQHINKKKYGLIGKKLGHSFSNTFFNKKFQDESINAEYVNFEIPEIGIFPEIIAENANLCGLNVTIPYKEQVIDYLNALDVTAKEIGAVNVIKVERNNDGKIAKLTGYNSDCIGFTESIRPLIKPTHKKALILGTGGAAKAVRYGLKSLGIEPIYVSRHEAEGVITYDQLKAHPELLETYTVIVNTTPLGMYPNIDTCVDIPYDHIGEQHLCFDAVYNPETTLFMKKCAERGAVTKNGIDMLHMQAIAAWDMWNK